MYMTYFIIFIRKDSAKIPQCFLSLKPHVCGYHFKIHYYPHNLYKQTNPPSHILLYLREQCMSEKEVKI